MKTGFISVYFLQSESDPPHFYTGFTEDLDSRLIHHNSGGDPHTAKYLPANALSFFS
jgi:predicted GIY-YIG superfamily endonuclease